MSFSLCISFLLPKSSLPPSHRLSLSLSLSLQPNPLSSLSSLCFSLLSMPLFFSMVCGFGDYESWFGWLFCGGSRFLVAGFGLLLVFWWWWTLMCGWFVVSFRGFLVFKGFVAGGGF